MCILIKNRARNYGSNNKRYCTTKIGAIFLGCLLATSAMSQSCRVAVTRCEVEEMLKNHTVPQPVDVTPLLPALVSLIAAGTTSLAPTTANGPTDFSGNSSITLYAQNHSPYDVTVVCNSGRLVLYGYSSADDNITNAVNNPLSCSGSLPCVDTNVSITSFSVSKNGGVSSNSYTPSGPTLYSADSTVHGTLFDASVQGTITCSVTFDNPVHTTVSYTMPVIFSS